MNARDAEGEAWFWCVMRDASETETGPEASRFGCVRSDGDRDSTEREVGIVSEPSVLCALSLRGRGRLHSEEQQLFLQFHQWVVSQSFLDCVHCTVRRLHG